MPTHRALDNIDLLPVIAASSRETALVATWTHLLSDAIDAGEITFPIETFDQLEPLFVRARNTLDPSRPGQTLEIPSSNVIAPILLPCTDLDDFARKVPIVIRICEAMAFKNNNVFIRFPRADAND